MWGGAGAPRGVCPPPRQSTCALELDASVEDVLNRHEVLRGGEGVHRGCSIGRVLTRCKRVLPAPLLSQLVRLPLAEAGPDVRMVESLAPMWEEEAARAEGGVLPPPPPSPARAPAVLGTAVEAVRVRFAEVAQAQQAQQASQQQQQQQASSQGAAGRVSGTPLGTPPPPHLVALTPPANRALLTASPFNSAPAPGPAASPAPSGSAASARAGDAATPAAQLRGAPGGEGGLVDERILLTQALAMSRPRQVCTHTHTPLALPRHRCYAACNVHSSSC